MTLRRIASHLVIAVVALGAAVTTLAPPGPAAADSQPGIVHLVVIPGPESEIGTALTLTATIETNDGTAVDAGWVAFSDGRARVGRAEVDDAGLATLTYVPPTVGTRSFEAVYEGVPPRFDPASGRPVTHTVTGEPPRVPGVRLTVSPPDEAPHGAPIRLTAHVEDPTATGTVVFTDGDVTLATAEVVAAEGVAAATVEVVRPQGVRRLQVRYRGDLPEIGPSSSPVLAYSVLPATCADHARPGDAALVRFAFLSVLRRCPDDAGFAYWMARLADGASVSALARGLPLSTEGLGATVDAAYRQILHRPADRAGRALWVAKLRTGWTTSRLWAALAASPEFVSGDPAGMVDRAFGRILGRQVDEPSRPYWTDRFAVGPRSRALRALVLSRESVRRIIGRIHIDLFGAPSPPFDPHGFRWSVRARGDWRHVVVELLGRPQTSWYAQTYPDLAG